VRDREFGRNAHLLKRAFDSRDDVDQSVEDPLAAG
jgi:hypothetical protein